MEDAKVLPLNPEADAQQLCEREVLRLILNYPAVQLPHANCGAAGYLLEQVDETSFHGDYATLLRLCVKERAEAIYPDARYFYRQENTPNAVKKLIAELVPDVARLAPEWIEHSLEHPHPLPERELLETACENAILRLNKCNVERELSECLRTMEQLGPEDHEAYLAQIIIFKGLKQLDTQIAKLLGGVFDTPLGVPELAVEDSQTPGQRAKEELDGLIAETVAALEPLRATRHRGHQDVYLLLTDPDSKPAIVGQMQAADALMRRMHGRYHHYIEQEKTVAQMMDRNPAAEDSIHRLYEPTKVAMRLRALRMLCGELMIDFKCIVGFMPDAFKLDYFNGCHEQPAK